MQLTKYTKYKPLKKYDKAWDLLLSDVPDSDSEVNSKHVYLVLYNTYSWCSIYLWIGNAHPYSFPAIQVNLFIVSI